jgi:hypothetical protein
MKKILLILAVAFATASVGSEPVSAQQRVITTSVSNMLPASVNVLDEYISSQLYTGSNVFSGLNFRIGTFYKEHDNLSWDLYYTGFQRDKTLEEASKKYLLNPSGSQRLKYSSWSFGYGTYYHWRFGEKLMLKAGGVCDFYGGFKEGTPDGVNNHINIEGQIMFKGHAAIKYGWDFEKWGLDLRANLSLPAFGIITADHPSEPAMTAIILNDHSVMQPTFRHIFLGFYHNYMSLDYELGVDFVFKPFTLQLAYGSTNKWWNVYDLQNIRQINYLSLGCVIDIVTRSRYKTSNNNF